MDPFRSFFVPPKKGAFRGFFQDPEEEARRDSNQGEVVATLNRELGGVEEELIGPRKRLFGNATPDITVTAKGPPKNILTGIRRAAQIDVEAQRSPEAKAARDAALADRRRALDTGKRLLNDLAFIPGQPVLGAVRNIVSKGTALPDAIGGDLARRATSELDDLSAEAVKESGAIPGSQAAQIGGNVLGNIASEVALFRGSGKLLTKGAETLARSGSTAAPIGRRVAAISRLANRAKGGAGVAARTARDATAFLPLNLINSADRDLSAAGGFSDLSQRFFGGNVEEGKTKFLEDVSRDPLKRTAFELALDVGAGGIVEAGFEGLKRIKGLKELGPSRKASGQITETLRDQGAEQSAARRRFGSETLLPGPSQPGTFTDVSPVTGKPFTRPLDTSRLDLDATISRIRKESEARKAAESGAAPGDPVLGGVPKKLSRKQKKAAAFLARQEAARATKSVDTAPDLPPAPAAEVGPVVGASDPVAKRNVGAPIPAFFGRTTIMRFSDGTKVTVRYALVELDDLIPSHDPFTYQPNPPYPEGVQLRRYESDPTSQQINQQRAAELDADALLDPSFSPEKGPPTALIDGVVAFGNDRALAQLRAAEQFPERYKALRQSLVDFADQYGVDGSRVPGMRKPGLVRIIESTEDLDLSDINTLRRLNEVSDAVDTKGKRLLDQAKGRAATFREARSSLDHLASTVDPESTLSEYLTSAAGRVFVRTLIDDGVFTPAELPRLIDLATDTLTGEGRESVRAMMMVAALKDVDAIDRAPASILAKLEQAFVPLVRSSDGTHDLSNTVSQALDVMTRARARGVPLSGVIDQTGFDFAGAPVPPRVAAMARFLDSSPKRRVTEAFQAWARLADEARGNAESIDLLGGQGIESPAQAFARLFADGDPQIAALPIAAFPRQADLFTPRPDATGTGRPELPGKISEEELRARGPELVGPKREVAGADDPRQELLLDPRPTELPERIAITLEAGGRLVGAVDRVAAEELATRLRSVDNDLDSGRINRVSRGPESPDTPVLDKQGRPISRPLTRQAVTELATGAIGAGFGASEGDSFGERVQLGLAAGSVAALGGRLAGLSVANIKDARIASKSPQVKSMQRMVQILSEGFDIPIRSGVRWWAELNAGKRADALGYFDPNRGARIVRLRHVAQLSTGLHEIGHVLDNDFRAALRGGPAPAPIWQSALDNETLTELYGLGRSLYPAGGSDDLYLSEGFAEWVRRYTLGNDVDALVPKASNLLNQMLDSNPKWRQTIETIKADVARHITGTPEERALALMSGDSRGSLRSTNFTRDWLDRVTDIRQATVALGVLPEMVRGKRFVDNSTHRARMAARSRGMATWALNNGIADERTGQYLTRPFMQMVEVLTDNETFEFQNYLVAERTLEVGAGREIERVFTNSNGVEVRRLVKLDAVDTGMDLADAQAIVATHRAKYLPIAERVWEHQAAMIDLQVRAGVFTAAEGDWIKLTNRKHVPLYREFHAQTERIARGTGGASFAKSTNGMFRLKGSQRSVVPPLQSIIGDTYATYTMINQYRTGAKLLEEAQAAPDGAKVMKALKFPPVERVDVSVRQALKQLRDLGYPLADASKARKRIRAAEKAGEEPRPDDVELVALVKGIADQKIFEFRTIGQPSAKDRVQLVMPMLVNGKRKIVQVGNVDLFETLTGINASAGGVEALGQAAGGFLNTSANLLRESATIGVGFIKRNPLRDLHSSFRRTNIDRLIVPGEQLIRGLGVLLNHYANSTGVRRLAPPAGKERVFWQIQNLLDDGARAALRTQSGTAAIGGAIGASQGDTQEGRLAKGLIGAGVALGAKKLGNPKIATPGGGEIDILDLFGQSGGMAGTLSGLNVDEHARNLARLRDQPLAKRIVVNGMVEGLRTLAGISETATRLGEMQVVIRQELAKGASLDDATAAGLHAAAEVTQDFTKGGRLSMAWNQILPFSNANIRGKADFVKDMKDPLRVARSVGSITVASLALLLLQRDDPEYQDAPQYEKDANWVFIWPPKPVRDLAKLMAEEPEKMQWVPGPMRAWLAEMHDTTPVRINAPKPFDSGVMFGTFPERVIESILRAADDDPTTDPSQSGGLSYELGELILNLVNPFSAPPTAQAFLDLGDNKDFAGRPIVPRGLEFARAEDQATNRTGETARLVAKGTRLAAAPFGRKGIPAAQVQRGVSTVLGPTFGEIPLGVSDAVIRRVRERAGLPPQRALPNGGFTVPTNFTRTFTKGGDEGGGSAAVTQYQEILPEARQRWSQYINAEEGSPERAELAKDPLVLLYATGVGPTHFGALRRAERAITRLRDEKRSRLEAGDVGRAQTIDREIIEVARDLMQEVARARSNK